MNFNKALSIQQIKAQFNTQFPYLKIEFYGESHDNKEGSMISDQLAESTLLGDINPSLEDFEISINPEITVGAFEKIIHEKIGMNIQVFRKSNDIWLQTSSTDNWTLEKQNGKGQRSTQDYEIDPINITDFDVE